MLGISNEVFDPLCSTPLRAEEGRLPLTGPSPARQAAHIPIRMPTSQQLLHAKNSSDLPTLVWKTKALKFSPTWSNSCCSPRLPKKKLLRIAQTQKKEAGFCFSKMLSKSLDHCESPWLPIPHIQSLPFSSGLGLLRLIQFYDKTMTVCTMQFLWKHRGTAFASGGWQGKSLANRPNLPWEKTWIPLDAIGGLLAPERFTRYHWM